MRISITYKLTATIFLLFSLSAGILFCFILPALRSIKSTTDAMVANIEAKNEEFERLRLLRKSLTEIDTIQTTLAHTSRLSIPRSEEKQIIDEIESLALSHHVVQQLSVSYHAYENKTDFPGYYIFSFSVTGSIEHVRSYFANLESLPYYFLIKKIILEKNPEGNRHDVTLQFNAVLNSSSS